jgi:hypothetical protein
MSPRVHAAFSKTETNSGDVKQHQECQFDKPYPPEKLRFIGPRSRKEKQIRWDHPNKKAGCQIQRLFPRRDSTGS